MKHRSIQSNNNVLITDPKILAISVIDNNEPMIDLKNQDIINYGPSPETPNNTDYTMIRESVYKKLKLAQSLLPNKLRFCLYEGYRSLHLQKILFDARFEKIKHLYPKLTNNEIFIETTKLISPVINQDGSKNIPPHSTGGAIDIYLINNTGEAIDMGIHPKDWMSDNNGSLSLTSSKIISEEAQKNRKIMSEALLTIGFINYPAEYWHWSYGDRYWAYYEKKSHAIYDSYNN